MNELPADPYDEMIARARSEGRLEGMRDELAAVNGMRAEYARRADGERGNVLSGYLGGMEACDELIEEIERRIAAALRELAEGKEDRP